VVARRIQASCIADIAQKFECYKATIGLKGFGAAQRRESVRRFKATIALERFNITLLEGLKRYKSWLGMLRGNGNHRSMLKGLTASR